MIVIIIMFGKFGNLLQKLLLVVMYEVTTQCGEHVSAMSESCDQLQDCSSSPPFSVWTGHGSRCGSDLPLPHAVEETEYLGRAIWRKPNRGPAGQSSSPSLAEIEVSEVFDKQT